MKKYILIGGCSYFHKSVNTIVDILGYSDTESQIINIECPAGSNKYISESIILSIDSLIDYGVSSDDIIVINNFTQIGRINPIVPFEIQTEIKLNTNPSEKRKINNLTYTFYNSFVEIQNRMYSLMIDDTGLSSNGKEWYTQQEFYIENQKRFETNFEEYLESIVLLQSYLKLKNIKNLSFLMNNVFDGWESDFSHIYTKNKKWELPSTKNTLHISDISDFAKSLWNMIDMSSFVFYETENNKYGGIDEYFIDKFGNLSFLENNPLNYYQFYSNHPNEDVYELFTNDLMKSKLEQWK